jgi:hypothetical protein
MFVSSCRWARSRSDFFVRFEMADARSTRVTRAAFRGVLPPEEDLHLSAAVRQQNLVCMLIAVGRRAGVSHLEP